jgi:two-component system chemotaxis response regulator CheY
MAIVVAVDDNPIIRKLLKLSLSRDPSIGIHVFENGHEAIAFSIAHKVDVFIVDWFMHDYEGPLVIRTLRANPRYQNTPIVVLSADDDPALKVEAKHIGATGWMVKPFNPNDLKMLIYRLLGRYGDSVSVSSPSNQLLFTEEVSN